MINLTNKNIALLFLIFCSCIRQEENNTQQGAISIQIVKELSSNGRNLNDQTDFGLNIYDDKQQIVQAFESISMIPDIVYLPIGNYTAEASSNASEIADFDNPIYQGQEDFTIKNLSNTEVHIVCTLSNVKTKVSFTDPFLDVFPNSYAVIENESGLLTFLPGEERFGYFSPAPITVKVYQTLEDETQRVLITQQITEVQPQDFLNIIFNTQPGNGNINIEVDDTLERKDITFSVPADWVDNDAPTVISSHDLSQPLSYIDGVIPDELKLTFNSESGFTSLGFKITDEELLKEGWPDYVDFADLSESDRQFLNEKNIIWSENVFHANEVEIDLTAVLSFFTAKDNTTQQYQLSFIVGDNFNPQSEVALLQIEVQPAVFHLNLDENHVWSNSAQFSVDIEEGNVDNLAIQYQKKDTQVWLTHTQQEKVEDQRVYFKLNGLEDNTEYLIRAAYTKNSSDAEVIHTEEMLQLPNSDFEEWVVDKVQSESNIIFVQRGDIFVHHPFDTKNTTWATVNDKTSKDRGWSTFSYTSWSGTTRNTNAKNGRYSARVATIGYGKNNKSNTDPANVHKKSIGELFLGTYSESNDERNEGLTFTSRPAALKGWYQYNTLFDDTFSISVRVENRSGVTPVILAENVYTNGSDTQEEYQPFNIPLSYDQDQLMKATHICVHFKSSTKAEDEFVLERITEDGYTVFLGSALLIDQLSLEYN